MRNKNSVFRRTERCLYDYRVNTAKLESLRAELALLKMSGSVGAQSYESTGVSPSGGVHDPVAERLERIQQIEHRVRQLVKITEPITRLIGEIGSAENVMRNSSLFGLADIFKLYYVNRNIWFDVADRLGLGRSAFFKKRNRLIAYAADYLGFSEGLRLFESAE